MDLLRLLTIFTTNNMRLSLFEVETILRLKDKYFGKEAKIFLFGSRVDDRKKGGDIDLYIKSNIVENLFEKKQDFLIELEKCIGEQKIDVVFAKNENRLIEIEAKKGIELNFEKIKLQKYFSECDKHLQRIEEAYEDIKSILPISANRYQKLKKDEVQAIDQYLFRFSKLQDTICDKVFKLLIMQFNQNSENIPFIDILNQLEKIGFLYSAREWINLRKIRNEIAHQYDDEPEDMSQAINNILNQKEIIKKIYINLKNRAKHIIDDNK